MKQLGKLLTRIVDGLTYMAGWIAALSLLGAALIVTEGVIVRKILGVSTIWQIEASVFLLIFVVFGGAAFVQKNEHHLNVDLLIIHFLPEPGKSPSLSFPSYPAFWPLFWHGMHGPCGSWYMPL